MTRNRKGTVLRILKYLLANKIAVICALTLTLLSNYFALIGPKLSGLAIDAIGTTPGNVNFKVVFHYCILMIFFYVLSSILGYIIQIILINVSSKVTLKMREEVFNHLLTLPIGYFDKNQVGDIISKISYDIDTINTSLSSDLITVLTSVITVVVSALMMISISPQLCIIFLFTVPLIIIFTRYRTKKVKPLFSKRSRKLGELNGFVEEMLSGYKTIKAYGQEDTIVAKFDEQNTAAVDAYYDSDYQGSVVGPSVNFINNLSLSFVSMFGALLYLMGNITIGNISSFVLYSRKFSGPISETANILADLQSAISAAERVFRLLDEPSEIKDIDHATVLEDIQGNVNCEHVKFGYVEGKEIIHDLSFEALAGKMIAIVGPTGAGKTTIINLLMRFYDVNAGKILVDNHRIDECTRDSLRKQYAMVLQDTWLFSGSIFDNVAYGKDDATIEEVVKVCKAAHVHDFIETLKDGYDTILTDDGVNISKGQKQLLTIARAMLSESKMLILDEATSNVDSRTEMIIQKAMLELCKGKTSFVIAHRLSTIKNADIILVLQNGSVIESGTHEELLQGHGFYSKLFNAQFEN
ncbi:ABC transporter ATP-binding protein [Anaerorhabdus sp.]|uniref:ABC transporter ATP-binding protein n=1 Tax=Anaerorhabdus sp. TaxID=1872524 RepID=UPI002B216E5A|nr:ABC transporter ATP-binding protein [Anaerorhabdus sp.]MEA4874815.1 ABC transporter ATP-binding protein [Anaerorhabdus sp.]